MQVNEEQRDLSRPSSSASSHLSSSTDAALYGSGRSKFYVNPDPASYESLQQVPSQKQPTVRNTDRTLYLANSTFFRDNNSSTAGPPSSSSSPMPVDRFSVATSSVQIFSHILNFFL
jgi:hypothetical protein